jgi:hypothetical protein
MTKTVDAQFLHGRSSRFRGDDYDEDQPGSGWLAAMDTDIDMPINYTGKFRFRMCATNEDGSEADRSSLARISHEGKGWQLIHQTLDYIRPAATTHYEDRTASTDFGDDNWPNENDLYSAAWADSDNQWLVEGATQHASLGCDFPSPPRRCEGEWCCVLHEPTLTVGDEVRFIGAGATQNFQSGYDSIIGIHITAAVADASTWFLQHNRKVLSRILVR